MVNGLLQYWIWLSTRKYLSCERQLALMEHFGSPQEVFLADEAALASSGLELKRRELDALADKDLSDSDAILARCDETRISVLTWQDACYPERLKNISNPPLVLYYEGTFPMLDEQVSIAMVGSRRASAYGLMHTKRLGYQLGRSKIVVVSGGARGADTQALLGAMTAGYPVIAVLGCGTDVTYPAENKVLLDDIRKHGCLLSEYPPGTPPLGEHFPVRNRIISGLCQGVLVVEAPVESGAMITARHALDEGRDVFTIPANLGAEASTGNLSLLKSGAILVESSYDVLKEYAGRYPYLNTDYEPKPAVQEQGSGINAYEPSVKPKGNAPKSTAALEEAIKTVSEEEAALLRLLANGPMDVDSIIEHSTIPPAQVSGTATLLEIRGYLKRYPGHRFGLSEKLITEDSNG